MSPFASVRAFLQPIIPAPVRSRSAFTSFAPISTVLMMRSSPLSSGRSLPRAPAAPLPLPPPSSPRPEQPRQASQPQAQASQPQAQASQPQAQASQPQAQASQPQAQASQPQA